MNLILSDPNRTPKQISDCLKSMVREGYISEEQFQSLNKKVKDLNLENVISEIKFTVIIRVLLPIQGRLHFCNLWHVDSKKCRVDVASNSNYDC